MPSATVDVGHGERAGPPPDPPDPELRPRQLCQWEQRLEQLIAAPGEWLRWDISHVGPSARTSAVNKLISRSKPRVVEAVVRKIDEPIDGRPVDPATAAAGAISRYWLYARLEP